MKPWKLLVFLMIFFAGCAMFRSWKSIPPPGGCDQCHTQPISSDWSVAVVPVTLTDEHDKKPWQDPSTVLPPEESPLEQKKVTEQRCFFCHKGPDKVHGEYRGRYHH